MGKLLFDAVAIIVTLSILTKASLKVNAENGAALFVFGDSTVDTGNNNLIETIPEFQSNYSPYGSNHFFQIPTGRFSDGRNLVDFIAEYAKLPMIPSFLQPSIEYVNGVNFASGGGGILPGTNKGLTIGLNSQIKNFGEVKKSLTRKLGDEKSNKVISEAVYFISMGGNDYLGGYLGNPEMQKLYQPQDVVNMVIGNLTAAIQELYSLGGRKFGFLNIGTIGCFPALRAANPRNNGGCYEDANLITTAHNQALDSLLFALNLALHDFKYSNTDFYNLLLDRINNPSVYGFKEAMGACCGIGPYRGVFSCGGKKTVKEYELCENTYDFVFWDSYHPSEKMHQQLASAIWNGPSSFVSPFTLREFFDVSSTIIDAIVDYPQNFKMF